MAYEYITKDNLEDVQRYMYTAYRGRAFLEDYLLSRGACADAEGDWRQVIEDWLAGQEGLAKAGTLAELTVVWHNMDKALVDQYVKRFELRKRLFGRYIPDTNKPDMESGYREYDSYILLGAIVEQAYVKWGSLKYLNTLLKLDDTLLSLIETLNESQRVCVDVLLNREIAHVRKLAGSKGIAI